MRPPLTLISTECHPRGRISVSDGATRALSSCSQRCNSKFTVALRMWKPPRKTGVALCRLSRVCRSAMDNSVAFVLQDCATSRSGRSALQNVTFGRVSVKSRKYKSGDNLALLGPSLMFHAFCARFVTYASLVASPSYARAVLPAARAVSTTRELGPCNARDLMRERLCNEI